MMIALFARRSHLPWLLAISATALALGAGALLL